MSLAINSCHRAISPGYIRLIRYHGGPHADRLGVCLIMFTGKISLKRGICFALCDFVLYLCVFTNDSKQLVLSPLICMASQVTEADTLFDVMPFISCVETVTACAEQVSASKELVFDMLECGGEHEKSHLDCLGCLP